MLKKKEFPTYPHQLGNLGAMLERANPSCKQCKGTGKAGRVLHVGNSTVSGGKFDQLIQDDQLTPMDLTCGCVMRATHERVPWLNRHGKSQQPWLEENNGTTPDSEASKQEESGPADLASGGAEEESQPSS